MLLKTERRRLWLGGIVLAVGASVVTGALAATDVKTTVAVVGRVGEINPKPLVLTRADIPAGFRLDRGGVFTNEQDIAESSGLGPGVGPMVARSGRVTGYRVGYLLGTKSAIQSYAIVFRTARGASLYMRWGLSKDALARVNVQRVRVAPVGAEGWVIKAKEAWVKKGQAADVRGVGWRYGRIGAGIATIGLSMEQTIALARAQQRRMVAALR